MDSWFAYVYIKCEWMKVCVRASVCIFTIWYGMAVAIRARSLCSYTYGVAHHFVNVGIRRIHAKCWKMNSLARSFSSFALAPCDGHGCKCTHTHINLKSYSRRETTWFDHINFPKKKIRIRFVREGEPKRCFAFFFLFSVLFFLFFLLHSFLHCLLLFSFLVFIIWAKRLRSCRSFVSFSSSWASPQFPFRSCWSTEGIKWILCTYFILFFNSNSSCVRI